MTILGSGRRSLPLSAGGSLSVFASTINQGGVLRAPMGTITLGWDGIGTPAGSAVLDLTTPTTSILTLFAGSITSVSAVDPISRKGMSIPYGMSPDGLSWITPSGFDATLNGLPAKQISIAAQDLRTQAGSQVDISGGGDLYAYRWVEGNGGIADILASSNVFAVIPGYASKFSPYAPFNASATAATRLLGDSGYQNSTLAVGDQIYLSGSSSLAAGVYTLLPARYALQPGAVLVTPMAGAPAAVGTKEGGAAIVSGYQFNGLAGQLGKPATYSRFEVATSGIVRQRAEYADYSANTFLSGLAAERELTAQRVPRDAGHLILQSTAAMHLDGGVRAKPDTLGRGAKMDIAAVADIWITDSGGVAPVGAIDLNAGRLSSFGVESLLVGGIRSTTAAGVTAAVRTSNITVASTASALRAPEIILTSNAGLTVSPGASVTSAGSMTEPAERLLLSGDGTLLRVSGDPTASIQRSGATASTAPNMTIGANARISAPGMILDSTSGTTLDPLASLIGKSISLNSGQVTLVLDNPGTVAATRGLRLEGQALRTFEQAPFRSLLSYSSLDIYGTGTFGSIGSGDLFLRAAEIRGFNQGGGAVKFAADTIILDNTQNGILLGAVAPATGTLEFNAGIVRIGANQIAARQFTTVVMNASGGVIGEGSGGFSAQNALTINAPRVTSGKSAVQSFTGGGAILLANPTASTATVAAGLGANLTFTGTSITANSEIQLPSGNLSLNATAGGIFIGGRLSVAGTAQAFYDVVRYTDGGRISLLANSGSVALQAGSELSIAAPSAGGSAGQLVVSAPTGSLTTAGLLFGSGGALGTSGSFSLDVGSLPLLSSISTPLDAAGITNQRQIRVRNGSVAIDTNVMAHDFALSADLGSITVQAKIDASGTTGGRIALQANGNVTLAGGSTLTVAGAKFDSAGKGGSILLEAGTQRNGVAGTGAVTVQTGSTVNLSVAGLVAGSATTPGSSAFNGQFSGTLHLRAPQNAAGTNLAVNPIAGSVIGASSILVEGYRIFDLTNITNGLISNSGTTNASGGLMTAGQNVQASINASGQNFLGAAGAGNANYNSIITNLLGAGDPQGLLPVLVLAPGAELINRTGNLTLGSTSTTATSDWNLQNFRYGTKRAPGVLTLRAKGDLVFLNTLSDGFSTTGGTSLWLAPLMDQNTALPINTQSWSYRMAAGADLSAASFRSTLALSGLGANSGSLLLGKNYGAANFVSGSTGSTATAINSGNRFQVIRTGSGDISIAAGRDVRLLNQFASIYTAGTRVADATTLFGTGDFTVPIVSGTLNNASTVLGSQQQVYNPSYSMAGGNVAISAGNTVGRFTLNGSGALIDDSSRETPTNWLYRRGYIDPVTGAFGRTGAAQGGTSVADPFASTTWWIDFSNFFEGVGTLGGGSIVMTAGNEVRNVDAVAPTNARMASGLPDSAKLVELGGGDVTVTAGTNINGGVYYVERGKGTLSAAQTITTNATRSPSLGIISNLNNPTYTDSQNWLPTTLFLGKGGFDVEAGGDILLGPVVNAFLAPPGIGNKYWYKTYFSTYGPESFVNVSSLAGNVTARLESIGGGNVQPILRTWMESQNMFTTNTLTAAANNQPWLRLSETLVAPFSTNLSLLPPSMRISALGGTVNVTGDMNLFPSATGTLEIISGQAVTGLNPTGTIPVSGQSIRIWTDATINVSDSDPAAIPSITTPFAYHLLTILNATSQLPTLASASSTTAGFLKSIDVAFAESGSYTGSFASSQIKQALHASGPLHKGDTSPIRIYSGSGDITGLTLFSPKRTQVFAGGSIGDVAFYIQNTESSDSSIVAAGKDMVLYNANTRSRTLSASSGNRLTSNEFILPGDIQISGQGSLQVIAGRNLDLGTGANRADGTGVGITSIGNSRNPFLPFDGASIFIGAGLGNAFGLSNGKIQTKEFLDTYLDSAYVSELVPIYGTAALASLTAEQQTELAVRLLALVLRDVGRAATSTASGSYEAGYAAIQTLFGDKSGYKGDINTRSRDLRTKNGGSIEVIAPGGKLVLATSLIGEPVVPPGVVTEFGGGISIFTDGDVDIGQARIFTLRGGNIIMWSSSGDIAAGAAAKTVKTAPPTRVLIDPQSASVQTDLAGLATGGGIGVLSTVAGVAPGDVDLIAPKGTVDAGDAGIRSTGNLNIAAVSVLNASNIQVGGSSSGVSSGPTVAAPNIGGLTSANNAGSAQANSATDVSRDQQRQQQQEVVKEEPPSIFTIEVLGYGGD